MKQIELPILFHTENTALSTKLEMECRLSDYETRNMTFYRIDGVSPYIDEEDKTEYCNIHVNGAEYICNSTYAQVKRMIDECL
jgi:hypothetical protein